MNSTPLTSSERMACKRMSEIFLDIETNAEDIDSIAFTMVRLGFSETEVEHIFQYDVFPVVYPNIMSPVGVWAGFDQDWLVGEIEARRRIRAEGWGLKNFRQAWNDGIAWWTIGMAMMPQRRQLRAAIRARLEPSRKSPDPSS